MEVSFLENILTDGMEILLITGKLWLKSNCGPPYSSHNTYPALLKIFTSTLLGVHIRCTSSDFFYSHKFESPEVNV